MSEKEKAYNYLRGNLTTAMWGSLATLMDFKQPITLRDKEILLGLLKDNKRSVSDNKNSIDLNKRDLKELSDRMLSISFDPESHWNITMELIEIVRNMQAEIAQLCRG